jgi:hypothetical protein
MRPLAPVVTAAAVVVLTLLVAGCGSDGKPSEGVEPTVYEDVRAEFRGTASDGRDIVVVHERIPGFMDAMLMTLPLADPSAAEGLARGAKIRFDLVTTPTSIAVRDLETLPDTTTLDLPTPAGTTQADTARADTTRAGATP